MSVGGAPKKKRYMLTIKDILITVCALTGAALMCLLLRQVDEGDIYVSMIFLLAVAVVSRFTTGYFYGIAASVIGVLGVSYAFTAPYFEFSLYVPGYPLSFVSMLAVSITTSTMTTQIKRHEEQRYQAQVEEMSANLLRAVSHDLRTPLTSISGAASLLAEQKDMLRENQEALLKEIVDDSNWLVRMVENLLSITRINATPADLRKTAEAAEEVISESVRKFRKHFDHPQVEITLPDELLMVPMDPILIEQVLTNLLENVFYHAPSATRVTLRLWQKDGWAVFEVADDGPGIPPKKLPDLFKGESRSDAPSDGSHSMGIGLCVCKTIILAHGGDITAKNQPGGGACFRFRLPVKEVRHESRDDHPDC